MSANTHLELINPLVTRFFKGLYEINKPEPKYKYIWDVNTVLEYLKNIEPIEQITLKELTLKLAMLLLLATGQRGQSMYLLSLDGMTKRANSCTVELMEHIKTSKPNKSTKPIEIRPFQPDKTICQLTVLKASLDQENRTLEKHRDKVIYKFHTTTQRCFKRYHIKVDKKCNESCGHRYK